MDFTLSPERPTETRTNGVHGFLLSPAEVAIRAEQNHSPPAPTPTPVNGIHHTPAFRRPAAARRARWVCLSCRARWPTPQRSCLHCGGILRHSFYDWHRMDRYTVPRVRYLSDGGRYLVNGGEYDRFDVVDDDASDVPLLQSLDLGSGRRQRAFRDDNAASLDNLSDASTLVEGQQYQQYDGQGEDDADEDDTRHREAVTVTITVTIPDRSEWNPPAWRSAEEDLEMDGPSAGDADDEAEAEEDENLDDETENSVNGDLQSGGSRLEFGGTSDETHRFGYYR